MALRTDFWRARAHHGRLLGLGSLLAFGASGCAALDPEYGVSVPVVSRYVYRGAVTNREPVMQPEVYASAESDGRTWLVGVWSNVDLTDENFEQGKLTEYDVYTEVEQSLGLVRVALGLAHFRYEQPHAPSTSEPYVRVAADFETCTPALEFFYDVDEAQGLYANFNLSRTLEPAEDWSVTVLAGLGWMSSGQSDYNFGVDQSGFSDLLLQATLEHPLSERLSLGITAGFSSVLDGELRDAVSDPENLTASIGLGWTF